MPYFLIFFKVNFLPLPNRAFSSNLLLLIFRLIALLSENIVCYFLQKYKFCFMSQYLITFKNIKCILEKIYSIVVR